MAGLAVRLEAVPRYSAAEHLWDCIVALTRAVVTPENLTFRLDKSGSEPGCNEGESPQG